MNDFKIYFGFVNRYGEKFDNIRNVAFKLEKNYDFGTLKDETIRSMATLFESYDSSQEGVFIYQTDYDPNVALRIFKRFKDPDEEGIVEDRLVSRLQRKQPNVKNTDFPTGVVTLDGRVIGQEIVFYPEALDMNEYYSNGVSKELMLPTEAYLKIINNLQELYDNCILYLDIHNKNFMILDNGDVKIIDFEHMEMSIDYIDKTYVDRMISNLRMMFIRTNRLAGLEESLGKVPRFENLNQASDVVNDMDYKLKRILKR